MLLTTVTVRKDTYVCGKFRGDTLKHGWCLGAGDKVSDHQGWLFRHGVDRNRCPTSR